MQNDNLQSSPPTNSGDIGVKQPSEQTIVQPTINVAAQDTQPANGSQDIFEPYSVNNKAGQAATTFVLGGTKNVSRFLRFTKASIVFYVTWLFLLLCLIGMSYLHYKHGDEWLRMPFLIITAISVINVMYFGWVRREIVSVGFRSILPDHTIRGGTAVAYSFLYLIGVAIIAGAGWNFASFNKPTTSSNGQTTQTTQSTKTSP